MSERVIIIPIFVNLIFIYVIDYFSFERAVEEEVHNVAEEAVEEEEVVVLLHRIQNLKKNQYWIFQNIWTRKYVLNLMEDVKVYLSFYFISTFLNYFLIILNNNSDRVFKRT